MTLFAKNIFRRNFDVLKEYFRRVTTLDAHLVLWRSAGDTAKSSIDDEGGYFVPRHACIWILRGYLREYSHYIGDTTVRYPDFAAV